jgi:hypothetical protein
VKQGPKLGFLGLLIKKPEIKKISWDYSFTYVYQVSITKP